jgi:peroxiredoxin
MNIKPFLLFGSLLPFGIAAGRAQTVTTVVEGTVIDRPYSTTLLLSRAGEDMRIHAPRKIAVRDGRFSFRLETAQPQAYELAFEDEYRNNTWLPILFFPGDRNNDTVRMLLYPRDSASMNRVTGGSHNREYRHQDSLFTWETPEFLTWDSLQDARYENRTYYNAETQTLIDRLDNGSDSREVLDSLLRVWYALQETGRHMSLEAAATDRQMRAYADSVQQERYTHIRNHPSLAGYYWLYQTQLFGSAEAQPLREEIYRTVYAPRFPEHPYTARLDTVFYRRVQIGKPFVDFEAPDLDGRMHRLSDLIRGRVAVIDLWASWCGPCRRKSMAIISVYNEFKDKGFEVVGVAREVDDTDDMRKAVEKDGYPWPNLVELNDRAGIWRLYGVERAAGGVFAVGRDGTVLAIDPTLEELRKIVAKEF